MQRTFGREVDAGIRAVGHGDFQAQAAALVVQGRVQAVPVGVEVRGAATVRVRGASCGSERKSALISQG
eukprot:795246-Rhodomonas_salina.1